MLKKPAIALSVFLILLFLVASPAKASLFDFSDSSFVTSIINSIKSRLTNISIDSINKENFSTTPPKILSEASPPIATPSQSSSPAPGPKPTTTPTINPSTNPATSAKTYIMLAINNYRLSRGLSEVQIDPYTCALAKTRAQEISREFNHDGFKNRINNNLLPYPTYSEVTENIASTSDFKRVVDLWINSPGHAENMRKNTPYVCVENYGMYYVYEGWRP